MHDESGKIDPVKAEQIPIPRASAAKRRKINGSFVSPTPQNPTPSFVPQNGSGFPSQVTTPTPCSMDAVQSQGTPLVPPHFHQQSSYPETPIQTQWHQPASMYPDPLEGQNFAVNTGPYHSQSGIHMSYSQQSLEQLANDVLDSRYVNNDEDGGYTVPQQHHNQIVQNVTGSAMPPSTYMVQQQAQHLSLPHLHQSSDSGIALTDVQRKIANTVSESGAVMEATNADASLSAPVIPSVEPRMSETSPRTQEASLSSIPLYEPPPSAKNRRPSKISQSTEPWMVVDSDMTLQNRRRHSSAGKSPAPMGSLLPLPETPGGTKKRKRDSNASGSASKKLKPGLRDHANNTTESAIELQDDESVKLAKKLQDQEWGLRRRSKEV